MWGLYAGSAAEDDLDPRRLAGAHGDGRGVEGRRAGRAVCAVREPVALGRDAEEVAVEVAVPVLVVHREERVAAGREVAERDLRPRGEQRARLPLDLALHAALRVREVGGIRLAEQ